MIWMQESTRQKVPDLPMPAEQWTTLGWSFVEGCSFETFKVKNII
jgi:hypothetical protein